MKQKVLLIIIMLFSLNIYADENNLLNEYNLLYTDLMNLRTWGYRSFFNNDSFQANENINTSQGAINITNIVYHFAIVGEGFFKIKLEDNLIGYTRSGEFSIDSNGNIRTQQDGE